MLIRIITVFLCCISMQLSAEVEQSEIPIWPDLAPGTESDEDKEYTDEKASIYAVYQPSLTVYLANSKQSNSPAIIVLPGGGYRKLDMEKEGHKIARWLNANGSSAFVLKYRLTPQDALRDAQRAVSLLRHKADEFDINPEKIGVIGFSAGGHVAGSLVMNHDVRERYDAIDKSSSRPDFWIGVYGAYQRIYGESGGIAERSDVPPGFFAHAANDSKVDVEESIRLFTELRQVNAPAELHVYEQGEHGFALEKDRGEAVTSTVESWSMRCIEWLKVRGFL